VPTKKQADIESANTNQMQWDDSLNNTQTGRWV